MQVEMVAFAVPKRATSLEDWEDGTRFDEGFRAGQARMIVADGATEAFDTNRWVGLMVETFVPAGNDDGTTAAPQLDGPGMRSWFTSLQQSWQDDAPVAYDSIFAADKFKSSGSFATMVGCEVDGLGGRRPTWRAVAVGDTVLFHVRSGGTNAVFPPMATGDFNNRPATVHTDPRRLEAMMGDLRFGEGDLALDDWLFIATDAFADWIIKAVSQDEQRLWSVLASIDNDRFQRLVDEYREAGLLKDDDVTLLRAHLVSRPSPLAVAR